MYAIHRHLDTEEAERYLMGRSPDTEAAGFEEHLLVCARCRQHMSSLDLYVSSIREAAEEVSASKGFTVYGNWQLLKLLAAVGSAAALAILGMLAAYYYR